MKKLMFVAAVALAGAVFADDSITSENVVGYATKESPANKFRLVGVPFEAAGTGSLNVNDLVPWTTDVSITDENWTDTAPQFQPMNADGDYQTLYFVKDAMYFNDKSELDYKPGWVDYQGVLATQEYFDLGYCSETGVLVPGAGAWVKDPLADVNFLANGGIIGDDVAIDCPETFKIRAAAFPCAFNVNDATAVEFSNMPAASISESFTDTAAQIQIQNANGDYQTLYWVDDAMYFNDQSELDYKPGWTDYQGVLAIPEYYEAGYCSETGDCNLMAGIWSKGVSQTFTMKFLCPIAK